MISGIDSAAHIGGLVGGYLSALSFGVKGKTNNREKINGVISLIILIMFLLIMIFKSV